LSRGLVAQPSLDLTPREGGLRAEPPGPEAAYRRIGQNVREVELNKYERLGGGWIATELVFKRNGEVATTEEYLTYGLLESIPAETFDVRALKPRP